MCWVGVKTLSNTMASDYDLFVVSLMIFIRGVMRRFVVPTDGYPICNGTP